MISADIQCPILRKPPPVRGWFQIKCSISNSIDKNKKQKKKHKKNKQKKKKKKKNEKKQKQNENEKKKKKENKTGYSDRSTCRKGSLPVTCRPTLSIYIIK